MFLLSISIPPANIIALKAQKINRFAQLFLLLVLTFVEFCGIMVLCLKHNTTKKETQIMKLTLKAARVNAGLTQEDVAKKLKKSKNTIVNYENGKSVPDIETGKALAALYGLSVDDLNFLPAHCALSTN